MCQDGGRLFEKQQGKENETEMSWNESKDI